MTLTCVGITSEVTTSLPGSILSPASWPVPQFLSRSQVFLASTQILPTLMGFVSLNPTEAFVPCRLHIIGTRFALANRHIDLGSQALNLGARTVTAYGRMEMLILSLGYIRRCGLLLLTE